MGMIGGLFPAWNAAFMSLQAARGDGEAPAVCLAGAYKRRGTRQEWQKKTAQEKERGQNYGIQDFS